MTGNCIGLHLAAIQTGRRTSRQPSLAIAGSVVPHLQAASVSVTSSSRKRTEIWAFAQRDGMDADAVHRIDAGTGTRALALPGFDHSADAPACIVHATAHHRFA